MTIYNTNIVLVNDNVLKKLVSISLFFLKVLNKKMNSDVNQGPQLCCQFVKKDNLQSNVDLVNDNVYTKFGLNGLFVLKILRTKTEL